MSSVLKKRELCVGLDESFDIEKGADLDEKTAEKVERFIEDAEREGLTVTASVPSKFGRRRLILIAEEKRAELSEKSKNTRLR